MCDKGAEVEIIEFSEMHVYRLLYMHKVTHTETEYVLHYVGPWEWDEDGYVDRDIVIRRTDTGALFKSRLHVPLVARNEFVINNRVTFCEVRETKIEVPHFEYTQ